jgi:SAM-dependent methyltransferase
MSENNVSRQLATGDLWENYYRDAEADDWIAHFWNSGSPFRSMFDALDLTNVIEFACGHGRHAAQIIDRVKHITLVDANPLAIDACRARFKDYRNVSYLVNSGDDLSGVAAGTCTALFSYDAMVHFEPRIMIGYIDEIARILLPGGKALLHYSNYDAEPESSPFNNRHWRNFFSEKMMRAFASRAGLSIVRSLIIPWQESNDLDAITLLQLLG